MFALCYRNKAKIFYKNKTKIYYRNKTKIFLLIMKRRIQWYNRYFRLSLFSLFTEAIKACVKLFFVVRVFYPMYFNGKYLKTKNMQSGQVFAQQVTIKISVPHGGFKAKRNVEIIIKKIKLAVLLFSQ